MMAAKRFEWHDIVRFPEKTMQERNNQQSNRPDDMTGKNNDRQGIDKAPGEETAGNTENVVSETQKGKNKVDGDMSKESDRPLEQE